MDRKTFFDHARQRPFGGAMTQTQVDGLNALLDGFDKHSPGGDPRFLAYELATAYWETDRTLQPIREIGEGKGRVYGAPDLQTGQVYCGRGYVQLTWKQNYKTLSAVIGVDLVADPDAALKPDIAAQILFVGMERGLFTTKKLADYFTADKSDWINARRIVNGLDHAFDIAAYAQDFFAAITAANVKEKEGKAMTDTSGTAAAAATTVADLVAALERIEGKVEDLGGKLAESAGAPHPLVTLVESLVHPMLPAINQRLGVTLQKNNVAVLIIHGLGALVGMFNPPAGQSLTMIAPAPKQ